MRRGAATVIGASGGLGRASALALAQDFDGLALTYRNGRYNAEALASELPGHCKGCQCIATWPNPKALLLLSQQR